MEDGEQPLAAARAGMAKSLESLHHETVKIRTGRANPALLEGVMVDYYGTPTRLQSLATLSAPEARLITVQPFDAGAVTAIEKAILRADLGLSPLSDGKILRVPVPELTQERRQQLVRQIKHLGEDHRVGIRSVRRDAISKIKEFEKGGTLSKDDSRRLQGQVQDLTTEHIEKVDEAIAVKEQEILRI